LDSFWDDAVPINALMKAMQITAENNGGVDGDKQQEMRNVILDDVSREVYEIGFYDRVVVIVDPSAAEENASDGLLTVSVNRHGELCGVTKAGGVGLTQSSIETLVKLASLRVIEIQKKVNDAIESDTEIVTRFFRP
jgi:exosome complex RNA-binding protein Rrp42 (RNase PH superfamily)